MIRMKADVNGVLQGQSKVTAQQRVLNNVLNKTNATGKHAARGIGVATKANNMLAKSIQHAAHMAVGTFGLFQLQRAGAAALDTLGKYQDLRTRITGLTGSTQAYSQAEAYLVDVSRRHNKEVLVLADSYSKLLALQKGGILTQQESKQILEGMSNAASHFGASSEQLKQSLFGMSQGLTSPILRAEELNQVVEPLPGLLQDLDKAAKLPAGGFRQMVVAGKITSDFFKSTLIKAFKSYEGAAAATSDNVNAKFAQLNTTYTLMVAAFEKPINSSLDTFFTGANDSMQVFTDNAELITNAVGTVMTFALIRATVALGNYTAKKISTAIASKVAADAEILAERKLIIIKTEAAHIAALVANKKALEAQATAKQLASTYASVAAVKNLAVANVQVAASERALITTRAALIAPTVRLSLATKTLSIMSGVVGGLPGLLTLAAFSMYSFASSTDEAANKAKKLNHATKNLNPFANYTASAAKAALQRYQGQLALAEQLADEARVRFNNTFLKGTVGQVKIAEKNVEILTKKIAALQAILEKPKKATNVSKVNTNAQSLLNNLNKQVALYGKVGEVAKIRYAIEHGALKGINKELKAQILSAASQLDNKSGQAQLAQLEASLKTQEQAINISYKRRLAIAKNNLGTSAADKLRFTAIELKLQKQRDKQLDDLAQQRVDKQTQRENELRQLQDQQRRDQWDTEIAQLQGFNDRKEAEEQAHQDRMRDIRLRNAGQYGDVVRQFVQFDRSSGADRLSVGLQIAQGLTSINANESKKQFELNKKVSIANAMVSTFLAITNAYADLPYPVNIAASIAIGAMGLANVARIRSQQFQGQAHDGLGRVMARNEGTWVLKQDEMVLNPQQRDNFETLVNYAKQQESSPNQASAYAGTTVNISNSYQIDATGAAPGVETAIEAALDEANRRMRQELADDFGNGGPLAQRLKGQAA